MTGPEKASPSARRVAMDALARREHSREELRRKLLARDLPTDEVEAALDALQAEGLASDARFAEAFVTARSRRGQGPRRIRAELEARGVVPAHADEPLRAVDWGATAAAARQKKFGAGRPADLRERARQVRFLEYRGFTGEQIRQALEAADESV